jgi:NAD(P)-dependent dehydrogenase (short-subunit alcohol dehydrogenase family)
MAGIGGYVDKLIVDLKQDDWDPVIAVNLTGAMNCIRAQLRHMTDGGSIVNAASTAGFVDFPSLNDAHDNLLTLS